MDINYNKILDEIRIDVEEYDRLLDKVMSYMIREKVPEAHSINLRDYRDYIIEKYGGMLDKYGVWHDDYEVSASIQFARGVLAILEGMILDNKQR